MSYFKNQYGDDQHNLNQDYGFEQQAPSYSLGGGSGDSSAASDVAAAGIASKVSPVGLAGGFLLNYLQQRAAEFQKKKEQELAIQRGYSQDQEQALGALGNNWKSALLK